NRPGRRLIEAVVLSDVQAVLLDEVQPLAQLEARAHGLAVVHRHLQEPIYAIEALGIVHPAAAHQADVGRDRGRIELDVVDYKEAVVGRRAVGIHAQHQVAGNRGLRRRELRAKLGVAGAGLRRSELQARGVDAARGAEQVYVQRALRQSSALHYARAHVVTGIRRNQRHAEEVLSGWLGDKPASRSGAVAHDSISVAPDHIDRVPGAAR